MRTGNRGIPGLANSELSRQSAEHWNRTRIHALHDRIRNGEGDELFFTPADRIGQLTLRDLDIIDTREKLRLYGEAGLLGQSTSGGVPLVGSDKPKKK